MARTHLLTGEDAEIRSMQDGAQPSFKNKKLQPAGLSDFASCLQRFAAYRNRAVFSTTGPGQLPERLSERIYRF
jgi:hypothetical protein